MAVKELSDLVGVFEKADISGVKVKQITDPRSIVVSISNVSLANKEKVAKRAFGVLCNELGLGTVSPQYNEGTKELQIIYDMSGKRFLEVPGCGSSMSYSPQPYSRSL